MLKKIALSGTWTMACARGQGEVQVPGDFYSDLLALGYISDPYFSDNVQQLEEIPLNVTYTKTFVFTGVESTRCALLRFHGVDTLAQVYLNGHYLGRTNNMHCLWEFEVSEYLVEGENHLCVELEDPRPYFAEHHKRRPLRGGDEAIDGYQSLRKAHFMAGWDFAPRMLNVGLFRPVELLIPDKAFLRKVSVRQDTGAQTAMLCVQPAVQTYCLCGTEVAVTVTDPDNKVVATLSRPVTAGEETELNLTVSNPQLWWPNGLGAQPLYTVTTVLTADGEELDRDVRTVGLRSLQFCNDWDAHGREFSFLINGKKPFIKGANYVPEDCLMSRRSRERTARLLRDCATAHYNMIRVWGGGIYPDEWFFDLCDELGLLVWLDVMYACCFVDDDPELFAATDKEVEQNLARIGHRACLALLCGNNEIEEAIEVWDGWKDQADSKTRRDYLKLFEGRIPELIRAADVETAYIPSSPTSGGSFQDPGAVDCMDSHYWKVWHHNAPYESYRDYYFRFLSEFGFESFPSPKTLLPRIRDVSDLNVYAYEMEHRQRCRKGNQLIMQNMGSHYRMPTSFRGLVYLSQLMQADAMRYAADHMRRNREQCMGTLYWQINDCWPGVSWSSIDYDGRWKAVHYAAREFYAPESLILTERDTRVLFSVSNETSKDWNGIIRWQLIKSDFEVVRAGEQVVSVPSLSATDIFEEDFSGFTFAQRRELVLVAKLYDDDGEMCSERVLLLTPSKHFLYRDPHITAKLSCCDGQYFLTLRSEAFAQNVWLEFAEADGVFSRNFFSITSQDPLTIRLNVCSGEPRLEDLQIVCVNTVADQ